MQLNFSSQCSVLTSANVNMRPSIRCLNSSSSRNIGEIPNISRNIYYIEQVARPKPPNRQKRLDPAQKDERNILLAAKQALAGVGLQEPTKELTKLYRNLKSTKLRVEIGDMVVEEGLRLPLNLEKMYLDALRAQGRIADALTLWNSRLTSKRENSEWLVQGIKLCCEGQRLVDAEKLAVRLSALGTYPEEAIVPFIEVYSGASSDRLKFWVEQLASVGSQATINKYIKRLAQKKQIGYAVSLLEALSTRKMIPEGSAVLGFIAQTGASRELLAKLVADHPSVLRDRYFAPEVMKLLQKTNDSQHIQKSPRSINTIADVLPSLVENKSAEQTKSFLAQFDQTRISLNTCRRIREASKRSNNVTFKSWAALLASSITEHERLDEQLQVFLETDRFHDAFRKIDSLDPTRLSKSNYRLIWQVLNRSSRLARSFEYLPDIRKLFYGQVLNSKLTLKPESLEIMTMTALAFKDIPLTVRILNYMTTVAGVTPSKEMAERLLKTLERSSTGQMFAQTPSWDQISLILCDHAGLTVEQALQETIIS